MEHERDTRTGRIVALMERHEVALAEALERELFPDGAPVPLTMLDVARAQFHLLDRSAQRMAESDAAHNAALRRGGTAPESPSLLSQAVAVRLARQAEMERLVMPYLVASSERVQRLLFAERPCVSMLDLLRTLRGRIESVAQHLDEPGAEQPTPSNQWNGCVRMYIGFAALGDFDDLSRQLEEIADIRDRRTDDGGGTVLTS